MKPLTIEIHGTGTHNRGAEFMAIAICERMRNTFPGVRIVVPPWFWKPQDRARYGLLTHWEKTGKQGWWNTLLAFFRSIGKKKIISPTSVNVVLDASGFAYSDQWGPGAARAMARKMGRFYRKPQPLVLLPQALGSFKKSEVSSWGRELFKRASLVCARDEISYSYAQPLVDADKLRLYPDFTIGVAPIAPQGMDIPERFVAIVPNKRMLDKTKGPKAEAYLGFLRHAVTQIRNVGLTPVFLIHDSREDRRVVELMGEQYLQLPILTHTDPRVLKGILGKAHFVIGSRFHALVGALSQGIPCIGAGWSHKYPELFRDFACPALLISDLNDVEALSSAIDSLSKDEARNAARKDILEATVRLKARIGEMWAEVEDLIRKTV